MSRSPTPTATQFTVTVPVTFEPSTVRARMVTPEVLVVPGSTAAIRRTATSSSTDTTTIGFPSTKMNGNVIAAVLNAWAERLMSTEPAQEAA